MTATGRGAACVIILLFVVADQTRVAAHSGLRFASPLEGSTLGASPTHVQLTFIERPEPSLSTIRVSDTNGQTFQIGEPEPLGGDPLTLTIALRQLPRGVYVVNWRVVSAVDGHATAGAFAFGVQLPPTGPAPIAAASTPNPVIEIAARSIFLLGLVIALGAATYHIARLGDKPWTRFATIGLLVAAGGLALLIAAQWRAGEARLAALIGTSIGRAWIARGGGIGIAFAGVAIAMAGAHGRRRAATTIGAILVWAGTGGAIATHAFAGHAAAGRFAVAPTVMVHAIHAAAAGIWIGGLAMVLAGLRNAADASAAAALRRFSTIAAIGLVLVTLTGIARSIQEVGSWQQLTSTYGVLVIAKAALLLAIAILGAMNRWRHLPAAFSDTGPLRRTARAELAFAVVAIAAAGALSTLPPPAAANALPGIEVSGADFATTMKATLIAVSDQPGPNRFTVALEDYDSGEPVSSDRVSLRFTPIDDPGVVDTTLPLTKDAEGLFTGTGANVAFDGRWRATVLIERGSSSAEVPLEFEARGRPQRTAFVQVPNEPRAYRIEATREATAYVRFEPEKAGENDLQIWFHNALFEPLTVTSVVANVQSPNLPVQPLVISRVDRHRFTTRTALVRGRNRLVVIARTENGARVRVTLELEVSNGG